MAFSLTWLPQALRAAGLKVAEQPGWAERGRAPMAAQVRGVICHHTATPNPRRNNMPSLRLLTEGRSDLPGPLAQVGLGLDGTYYVIAAGRANHAGAGSWRGFSGNGQFIGIEAENEGDLNWPDVQMDAYRRGVAAILKQIGAEADMCCGHREYAPGRKPDPKFDMHAFRDTVRSLMNGSATTRPIIAHQDAQQRPTLRRGARGDFVKLVQGKIGVAADGIFGPGTEAAVREWQRTNGLEVADGIVGPKTWLMMFP